MAQCLIHPIIYEYDFSIHPAMGAWRYWGRHEIRVEAILTPQANQIGAHLLLQVRTLVLNGELHDKFQQWYPGLAAVNLCQSL
jgi:hypothetical protein